MEKQRRRCCIITGFYAGVIGFMIGVALLIYFLLRYAVPKVPYESQNFNNTSYSKGYINYTLRGHWPGWSGINELVVFGDSWTSTGFNFTDQQPSAEHPLGNPWPVVTGTGGSNWIDHITLKYNESKILTYNYAWPYSFIDPDGNKTSRFQLEQQILVDYNGTGSDTSLYVIWIGVNDILNIPDTPDKFEKDFVIFPQLLNHLYDHGARNLLILNAAALERCPQAKIDAGKAWLGHVAGWNQNITTMVNNFDREGMSMFLFDAHTFFGDVMDQPCRYKESCGFKDVTGYCDAYAGGENATDEKSSACPYAVNEYMWLNAYHPTPQMQMTIAKGVSEALGSI